MNFYHFIPVPTLQALMRRNKTAPLPTLCPTPNLIGYCILTLYSPYERPLVLRLSQETDASGQAQRNPAHVDYFKLDFEERRGQNHFTLGRLTEREQAQVLSGQALPGGSLVFSMPKAWEQKQNKALTGGTLIWIADDLVTVFQNNLMQVIDARMPQNAQLYPDGRSKHEAAKNIHAYAQTCLKGYQRWFEKVLKDPHRLAPCEGGGALNQMNANTLGAFKKEQTFALTLKTVTNLLGNLVGFYQQNQVSRELEHQIVREVSALPLGKLTHGYL
jgi:hypothetical protein